MPFHLMVTDVCQGKAALQDKMYFSTDVAVACTNKLHRVEKLAESSRFHTVALSHSICMRTLVLVDGKQETGNVLGSRNPIHLLLKA